MFAPLIPVLGSAIGTLLDRLIPDEHERAKAKLEMEAKMLETLSQADISQMEVNKEEAKHSSIWVAGWRPGIGWICVVALAYQFLLMPVLPWLVQVYGGDVPPLPSLGENLFELVFAMLGMGTLRTWEKWKGVAK